MCKVTNFHYALMGAILLHIIPLIYIICKPVVAVPRVSLQIQLLPQLPSMLVKPQGEVVIPKAKAIISAKITPAVESAKIDSIKTVNNIANFLDANTNNPPIVYPLMAKVQKQQGVLVLLLALKKNGSVAKILVEKSSGFAILDATALQTVSNWHFKSFNGEQENTLLRVPIQFMLN